MKISKKEARRKRTNTRHRWKDVERNVASYLTALYSDVGKSKVERIPLLGREGPDLTINEVGLVINVKSRAIIPARLFSQPQEIQMIGELACFRMEDLRRFSDLCAPAYTDPWKQLTDWYTFMDKWTKEFKPEGITAIIIHHPRMPIGKCGIVIHNKDLRRLSCQIKFN